MLELPDFPWNALAAYRDRAAAHSDGIVDLSVGTPVDPVPQVAQQALSAAADSPGYPTTIGSEALRAAAAAWLSRRCGVEVSSDDILSLIGTKEFVAWLPTMLGLGSTDTVVVPQLAYPTYEIGARIAGCRVTAADSLLQLGPSRPALLWLNSPANPTGRVLGIDHLKKVVGWARDRGVVVASDECYLELGWAAQPVSILHPDVCEGSDEGLLAVHSLSKRSNLAGYRYGFVTGDSELVTRLQEVAKHAGMMVPAPVQAAATAALGDDQHVAEQRGRYRARREVLLAALTEYGFRIDESEAGLYLWATLDEPCWETVARLANLGILVAPGSFYGPAGANHVRVALTAGDERVSAAGQRLHLESATR